MKNRIAIVLSSALAAGAVFAQTTPAEHAQHHPEGQAASAPAASMPMMAERMKNMQEQMRKIDETKSPAERKRLMDEHMKAMQQGMSMMSIMGGMGGASPVKPGQRMQMPEQRMDMMEQMMQHGAAVPVAGKQAPSVCSASTQSGCVPTPGRTVQQRRSERPVYGVIMT